MADTKKKRKPISLRWHIRSTEKLNEAMSEYLGSLDLPADYSKFVRNCVRKELNQHGFDLSPEDVHP